LIFAVLAEVSLNERIFSRFGGVVPRCFGAPAIGQLSVLG
jgi:hypothetical protein